jgi:hypothetical protein
VLPEGSETSGKDQQEQQHLLLVAKKARSQFEVAAVENELELEAQKEQAVCKLARRLAMKRKESSSSAAAVAASEEDSTVDIDHDEHCTTTSTKLKQHDMQSRRVRRSIVVAKEKSASSLQKRLTERAEAIERG